MSWSRPSDSNREPTAFETVASASWARARFGGSGGIRTHTVRVLSASSPAVGLQSHLAEGGGIEPLSIEPTLVFETSCQPSSGTLRVAERPGLEPGRVYNPIGLANRLRTLRTSPCGDDEVLLEQGMARIVA